MTNEQLLQEIEAQRALMISVATGGPRIQDVNAEYIDRRDRIARELRRRGLKDPNPDGDLWAWYGRWSADASGMGAWATRRVYVSSLYQALLDEIRAASVHGRLSVFDEPTGWERVDRTIAEVRRRMGEASTEEQFQAVGLLCREALISLAQVVFDPQRHATNDEVKPSDTDAKRMLDAYLAVELSGGPNEGIRRHAKAALSLANDLQHHRTAEYRQAALCAEATTSVVNLVAIVFGRRDRVEAEIEPPF